MGFNSAVISVLTLNLLTTTVVAPPRNAGKWQMGFNSAFKGFKKADDLVGIDDNVVCFYQFFLLSFFLTKTLT